MPDTNVAELKEKIWSLLKEIADPEIPVLNIVELGMIKEVILDEKDHSVIIKLIPTYTACPATWQIQSDIKKKMNENHLPAKVEIIPNAVWTTNDIHPEAMEKLKKYGIAPPQNCVTVHALLSNEYEVACPHCGSKHTQMVSAFGSTPCKAIFKCMDCKEPFDYFKCHF